MLTKNNNPQTPITCIGFLILLMLASPVSATSWGEPREIKDGYARQVEIIENQDGSLSLFSISPDREVTYRKKATANDNEWGKPKSLDIYANSIKLGLHEDGRIELFAIGTLGNVVTHISQVSPNSDEWTKEKEIKGIYAQQIELTTNEDDSLVAFFLDMNREISYIRQTAQNSSDWTSPTNLDTYGNQIAIGSHADGRLAVFIIGTLGNVLSVLSQTRVNSDDWSGEQEIKSLYGTQVEVGVNLDGTMNLFILQMDKEIGYIRQTAPGSETWSDIINLDSFGNLIEVGNNAEGKIEVLIVGTMGNVLTHVTQTELSGNEWTKEQELGGYAFQMRLGNNQNDRLELVYIAPFASQMFGASEIK